MVHQLSVHFEIVSLWSFKTRSWKVVEKLDVKYLYKHRVTEPVRSNWFSRYCLPVRNCRRLFLKTVRDFRWLVNVFCCVSLQMVWCLIIFRFSSFLLDFVFSPAGWWTRCCRGAKDRRSPIQWSNAIRVWVKNIINSQLFHRYDFKQFIKV